MIAQHRRARASSKASDAKSAMEGPSNAATFDRMNNKVRTAQAIGQAKAELASDSVEDRFAALEKADEIEKLSMK